MRARRKVKKTKTLSRSDLAYRSSVDNVHCILEYFRSDEVVPNTCVVRSLIQDDLWQCACDVTHGTRHVARLMCCLWEGFSIGSGRQANCGNCYEGSDVRCIRLCQTKQKPANYGRRPR